MYIKTEEAFTSHGLSLFKVYSEYTYIEIINDFIMLPTRAESIYI